MSRVVENVTRRLQGKEPLIRVTRVLMYEGPLSRVEEVLGRSLPDGPHHISNEVIIHVVTLRDSRWWRRLRAFLLAVFP